MRWIKHFHTEENKKKVFAEEERGEEGKKQEQQWYSITKAIDASETLLLGNTGIKRLYIIKSIKLV